MFLNNWVQYHATYQNNYLTLIKVLENIICTKIDKKHPTPKSYYKKKKKKKNIFFVRYTFAQKARSIQIDKDCHL